MRQKNNGTHLILMELMIVLFFFAVCGSILLQVFVKAHDTSIKAREMTETKNFIMQAAELIEAGSDSKEELQEYFTSLSGEGGEYSCYFDKNWKETQGNKSTYKMTIRIKQQTTKVSGKIVMWKGKKQIYHLDILRHKQERKDNERA